MLSFDTPSCSSGLYTNLKTFQSFGEKFLGKSALFSTTQEILMILSSKILPMKLLTLLSDAELDHSKTKCPLYLFQKWKRIEKATPAAETEEAPKITKMAIGKEGGFALAEDKYEILKEHCIVLMPSKIKMVYPNEKLPEKVGTAVEAVLAHTDGTKVSVGSAEWDAKSMMQVSKYAENLIQVPEDGTLHPGVASFISQDTYMRFIFSLRPPA